jgi:hypothetical protein
MRLIEPPSVTNSSLHARAQLAVDPINQPLGASELPALQDLSNEYQLWGLWGRSKNYLGILTLIPNSAVPNSAVTPNSAEL